MVVPTSMVFWVVQSAPAGLALAAVLASYAEFVFSLLRHTKASHTRSGWKETLK